MNYYGPARSQAAFVLGGSSSHVFEEPLPPSSTAASASASVSLNSSHGHQQHQHRHYADPRGERERRERDRNRSNHDVRDIDERLRNSLHSIPIDEESERKIPFHEGSNSSTRRRRRSSSSSGSSTTNQQPSRSCPRPRPRPHPRGKKGMAEDRSNDDDANGKSSAIVSAGSGDEEVFKLLGRPSAVSTEYDRGRKCVPQAVSIHNSVEQQSWEKRRHNSRLADPTTVVATTTTTTTTTTTNEPSTRDGSDVVAPQILSEYQPLKRREPPSKEDIIIHRSSSREEPPHPHSQLQHQSREAYHPSHDRGGTGMVHDRLRDIHRDRSRSRSPTRSCHGAVSDYRSSLNRSRDGLLSIPSRRGVHENGDFDRRRITHHSSSSHRSHHETLSHRHDDAHESHGTSRGRDRHQHDHQGRDHTSWFLDPRDVDRYDARRSSSRQYFDHQKPVEDHRGMRHHEYYDHRPGEPESSVRDSSDHYVVHNNHREMRSRGSLGRDYSQNKKYRRDEYGSYSSRYWEGDSGRNPSSSSTGRSYEDDRGSRFEYNDNHSAYRHRTSRNSEDPNAEEMDDFYSSSREPSSRRQYHSDDIDHLKYDTDGDKYHHRHYSHQSDHRSSRHHPRNDRQYDDDVDDGRRPVQYSSRDHIRERNPSTKSSSHDEDLDYNHRHYERIGSSSFRSRLPQEEDDYENRRIASRHEAAYEGWEGRAYRDGPSHRNLSSSGFSSQCNHDAPRDTTSGGHHHGQRAESSSSSSCWNVVTSRHRSGRRDTSHYSGSDHRQRRRHDNHAGDGNGDNNNHAEPSPPKYRYIPPTSTNGRYEPFMLVLVGVPGSGKSTLADALVSGKPWMYVRINQDQLGNRQECEELCRRVLAEGKCPIIDRCNFNPKQRKYFMDIAKNANTPTATETADKDTGDKKLAGDDRKTDKSTSSSNNKNNVPTKSSGGKGGVPVDCVVFEFPKGVCVRRCEMRHHHETVTPRIAREVVECMTLEFSPPLPNRINSETFRRIKTISDHESFNDVVLEYLNAIM